MARRTRAAATIAPRKSLLAWIDLDNGDKTDILAPSCSAQIQALHAHLFIAIDGGKGQSVEPLQPPPGLRLAPLG